MLNTLRQLLAQRPFQSFRVVMSSGREYDVRHPEMAMLTKGSLLVGIEVADDGVPAEYDICALLRVATVEPIGNAPSKPNQAGNGET